jgi:hypothetical protein
MSVDSEHPPSEKLIERLFVRKIHPHFKPLRVLPWEAIAGFPLTGNGFWETFPPPIRLM